MTLHDIPDIVTLIANWCTAQEDVTGFTIRVDSGSDDARMPTYVMITLDFDKRRFQNSLCLFMIRDAAVDVVTMALNSMAETARERNRNQARVDYKKAHPTP